MTVRIRSHSRSAQPIATIDPIAASGSRTTQSSRVFVDARTVIGPMANSSGSHGETPGLRATKVS